MLSKKDREGIVEYLESEFREDLSIHLYSTFLLHRINPVFPRRNWASWPLPIEEVPDPGSTKKYVDNEFPAHLVDYMKEDNFHDDQESLNSEVDEFSSLDPEPTEDQEYWEEDSNYKGSNGTEYLKVRSITNIKNITESKIDLLIELQALLEKKLHLRLHKLNGYQVKRAIFTSDFECGVVDEICKKLGNKVDEFVGRMIELQTRGLKKSNSSRAHDRLLNWQDVLLTGLAVEKRNRGKIISTDRYRRLYEKCERLFANVRYGYEYEHHTEDLTSEDEDQEESLQTRRENSFNYLDHISMLEETQNNITYKNFKERVLTSLRKERILLTMKQLLFANKLELEDRCKDLTWNNEEKGSRNNGGRTRKKFRILQSPQPKEDALNHGGLNLTAEDFTLDI